MSKEALVQEALQAFCSNFPDSVVGDLMMLFPDDVVLKIITTFSGETIKVPKVETVWRGYRDAIITDTLRVKDDKATRQRLAAYFGITVDRVNRVYNNVSQRRTRKKRNSIRRSAAAAYRNVFDEMVKEARQALR
jgi:hypothetical protein